MFTGSETGVNTVSVPTTLAFILKFTGSVTGAGTISLPTISVITFMLTGSDTGEDDGDVVGVEDNTIDGEVEEVLVGLSDGLEVIGADDGEAVITSDGERESSFEGL